MGTTPIAGLRYAELTDPANAKTLSQNLATDLDTKVVPRFATAAARDLVITAPVDGQVCYLTDAHVLMTYNSSLTRWTTPMVLISQQVTNAVTASITFSNIPAYFHTLELHWTARSNAALLNVGIFCRINSDSAAAYYSSKMQNVNTTVAGAVGVGLSSLDLGSILAASAGTGQFGTGKVSFTGWEGPHQKINCTSIFGAWDSAANSFVGTVGGMYDGTGPFTSLFLFPSSGSFIAACEFTLYGIA